MVIIDCNHSASLIDMPVQVSKQFTHIDIIEISYTPSYTLYTVTWIEITYGDLSNLIPLFLKQQKLARMEK